MKNVLQKTLTAAIVACMLLAGWPLIADIEDSYSDWTEAVNLGSPVNTDVNEVAPFISRDGLSLYFSAFDRPGGFGGFDLWVARRASVDAPWGEPENLGPTINSAFQERTPALSPDEHQLFFASNRPGGFGGVDLYVSRRHNKRDDFGWRTAVNLGPGVNSAANDVAPAYFEDDQTGTITLYFMSNRGFGLGGLDIYASTLQPDETFGPAALVEELSSPFQDQQPAIRRDGLEMYLNSNRPGTFGGDDLWVSTRASVSDAWSEPVNLGFLVNTNFDEGSPGLSFDGTTLYFHSNRPGGFGGTDLWVTARTKLQGKGQGKGPK